MNGYQEGSKPLSTGWRTRQLWHIIYQSSNVMATNALLLSILLVRIHGRTNYNSFSVTVKNLRWLWEQLWWHIKSDCALNYPGCLIPIHIEVLRCRWSHVGEICTDPWIPHFSHTLPYKYRTRCGKKAEFAVLGISFLGYSILPIRHALH